MFSDLGYDPIEGTLRNAVKRGYTVKIGPHEDAQCVIRVEKDGAIWGRACEIDERQIGLVLQKVPALWNYEVTPVN